MSTVKSIIRSVLPDATLDKLIYLKGGLGASPYLPYNDQYKTIFIHIPKTAGTSVHTSLFGNVKRNHIRLIYFEANNAKKYSTYFKFAFVRNPYERLFSSYTYIKQKNDLYTPLLNDYKSFEEFVLALQESSKRKILFKVPHFNTQFYYLKDKSGKVGVDYLGKFESLQDDFERICKRLGVEAALPHHNKTTYKSPSANYTESMIRVVNEVYTDDFENFGYSKL